MTILTGNNLTKLFRTAGVTAGRPAVDRVSIAIHPGECVGLIGRNGSGKTTLLKLLAGIIAQSDGEVESAGSLAALIEPASGIELDGTGRENLRNLYLLQGVRSDEVEQLVEQAVRFVDLGDFLDQPVRTYSSGMVMRLAFAGVVFLPVDLLLVDEVLSVGDPVFQRKCANEIRRFVRGGGTMILASHNYHEVASLCERVVFLDEGMVVADGPADDVFKAFWSRNEDDLMRITTEEALPTSLVKAHVPLAEKTGEMAIRGVRFSDGDSRAVSTVPSLSQLTVEIDYEALTRVPAPMCRVQFHRGDGLFVMGSNTHRHDLIPEVVKGPGCIRLRYEAFPLAEGDYFVSVGLWPDEYRSFIAERAFDYHENAYVICVSQERTLGGGLVASKHSWEWL